MENNSPHSSSDKNSISPSAADFPYEDIVSLPHPVSKQHPPMSIANRAAQFAPFAAMTGHDQLIEKTASLQQEEMLHDVTLSAFDDV